MSIDSVGKPIWSGKTSRPEIPKQAYLKRDDR